MLHNTTFAGSLGLEGKVAVITGAGGAICGAVAQTLAAEGVKVAIWDLSLEAAQRKADEITREGGQALAIACDVVELEQVQNATRKTFDAFSSIDILINGAGGSQKQATTSPELSFFDITPDALMRTMAINYRGTVLPCQTVGRIFAEKKKGVILNIASIAGLRPLTKAIAYSNSKSAIINFTQWLAVHMAGEYSPKIRVNAIAPGFVLTEQNRFLLVDEATQKPTSRGQKIISAVPMGRYGLPQEMAWAAVWLVSDAASFVTGAIIPVDGGFTAMAGV